jgi:hypothetical protein
MNKLSVGIVGIPIHLEKNHGILKESFFFGLTNHLRSNTEKYIKQKAKEEKIQLEVRDLGELVDTNSNLQKNNNIIGISKISLDGLSRGLKKKIESVDFLIVYGDAHTGAYLLYHLPGGVERFDIHDDDNEVEIPFHTSYMRFATEIKPISQVSNHGWDDLLDGILESNSSKDFQSSVFDVDIDYFTSTEYCKLTKEKIEEQIQKIKSTIRRAKPKVIGFFEYQTLDGSLEGQQRLLDIVWEGVKANCNL